MTFVAAVFSMSDGCKPTVQTDDNNSRSVKAETILTVGLLQSRVSVMGFVRGSLR